MRDKLGIVEVSTTAGIVSHAVVVTRDMADPIMAALFSAYKGSQTL
jgi:hypothetical protein